MNNLTDQKVFVAGHRGMVGSALLRRLAQENCIPLTINKDVVDLRNQDAVLNWMQQEKPDLVLLAAARVGGIYANKTYPAEFLYDNLSIATNVIHASHLIGVKKLLFLGSSCIYPRLAPQPMSEDALLSGPLEKTNEWYAIAKIAGLKLAEAFRLQYNCDFISCMPTNLYGPGDNYHPENSHVLPALIRKIHEAKKNNIAQVTLWGSGKPKREFLYVDDLADACIFLLKNYSQAETVNVGVGHDLMVSEVAQTIAQVIGYQGDFIYDTSMPDGSPQKLLNVEKMKQMGWQAQTSLVKGIELAYQDFLQRFEP